MLTLLKSTHYGDPVSLLSGVWTLHSMALLEAFIGGPVEIFFALKAIGLFCTVTTAQYRNEWI